MKFSVLIAALVSIAAVACSGGDQGGAIKQGETSVFKLDVGDCFQDPESFLNDNPIGAVESVDCGQPHDNEVYLTTQPWSKNEEWPGDDAVLEVADEVCFDAFEGYVGTAYEDSRLDFVWLVPTQNSWEGRDDREVVCVLYDGQLEKLTGSMKGSGE